MPDLQLLLKLARLCQVAEDPGYKLDWSLFRGIEGYEITNVFHAAGEAFAYLAQGDNEAALVFRGSETILDWIADGLFNQVPWFGGMVHGGFWALYDEMRPDIRAATYKGLLFITGHSLGGALATLCHLDLQESYMAGGTVTFASPRVGNAAAVSVSGKIVAVRNTYDIVPHLPPPEIYDPIQARWESFADAGTPYPLSFAAGKGWSEKHSIDNYISALEDGMRPETRFAKYLNRSD
jgi:triacylglycerol lipase